RAALAAKRADCLIAILLLDHCELGGGSPIRRHRSLGVDPVVLQLPIERRAADAEPARDFAHASAIMTERETDHLLLQRIEAADLAALVQEPGKTITLCRTGVSLDERRPEA